MKRFFNTAAVAAGEKGYYVELDGRAVKTPEKRQNMSPTLALATAICKEWNEQGDTINPDAMPISKLQNTVLDRVAIRRDELIGELVKYAGSDLLCYRADFPEDLVMKQAVLWQPLLDWVADTHGIKLTVTTGILHVTQDAAGLAELANFLRGMDSFRLAAFYMITTLCGSVTVALNLVGGNITSAQAWEAAMLDENYQIAQWGVDEEARIRQDNMKAELDIAIRFLGLLDEGKQA